MHETAKGKVRHEEPIKLLPDQFRSLAAQDDLGTPQVRLQLVQSGLNFPSLVIERRQFLGRGKAGIEDGGDQAIDRLRSRYILQTILDHTDRNRLALIPAIRAGVINTTAVGAIGE